MDFALKTDHRVKLKENEKKDKYLDFARELKKHWNMKVTLILIVIGSVVTVTRGLIQIGKNTKMSPGDKKRLAVTQIPEENHQLTPV